jgi:hypothetical protein
MDSKFGISELVFGISELVFGISELVVLNVRLSFEVEGFNIELF